MTTRIEKVLRLSLDNLYKDSGDFLQEIETGLKATKISAPRSGYQGIAGSFGEQAAQEYFGSTLSTLQNFRKFGDVLAALSAGTIDYGVLPIENSTAGDVLEVADLTPAATFRSSASI